MKFALAAVLTIASAGLAGAQTDQSTCQDFGRMMGDMHQRMETPQRPATDASVRAITLGARLGLLDRIRKQTGIDVAADCIDIRFRPSGDFRAQGNVTLTVGDVVITTDEAVVENGEIQLGNARVRLRAK